MLVLLSACHRDELTHKDMVSELISFRVLSLVYFFNLCFGLALYLIIMLCNVLGSFGINYGFQGQQLDK